MTTHRFTRPYAQLHEAASSTTRKQTRERVMQWFVDATWDALHQTGVSWIGFYVTGPGRDEMTLAARRDKPACSPIGLHGACGQAFTKRSTLIVTDVAKLGAEYIACDPRDKSELVIPLFEHRGTPWGVLDVDSYDIGSFGSHDADELHCLLVASGLTSDQPRPPIHVV